MKDRERMVKCVSRLLEDHRKSRESNDWLARLIVFELGLKDG
jgi:hypothetical protein